jgi:hypothetical protein
MLISRHPLPPAYIGIKKMQPWNPSLASDHRSCAFRQRHGEGNLTRVYLTGDVFSTSVLRDVLKAGLCDRTGIFIAAVSISENSPFNVKFEYPAVLPDVLTYKLSPDLTWIALSYPSELVRLRLDPYSVQVRWNDAVAVEMGFAVKFVSVQGAVALSDFGDPAKLFCWNASAASIQEQQGPVPYPNQPSEPFSVVHVPDPDGTVFYLADSRNVFRCRTPLQDRADGTKLFDPLVDFPTDSLLPVAAFNACFRWSESLLQFHFISGSGACSLHNSNAIRCLNSPTSSYSIDWAWVLDYQWDPEEDSYSIVVATWKGPVRLNLRLLRPSTNLVHRCVSAVAHAFLSGFTEPSTLLLPELKSLYDHFLGAHCLLDKHSPVSANPRESDSVDQ